MFVCLSGVCDGICWKLFVFTVRSCTLMCAPVRSREFSGVPVSSREFAMNPNRPLSDIIFQSRAILWFCYNYKYALEFPITFMVHIRIGIWMPYYFYHKCPIWHLNTILYWKLSQLLPGGVFYWETEESVVGDIIIFRY